MSCLHGKLRSWKTDKSVSKRTTQSQIKNLLFKDKEFLQGRIHSSKYALHMHLFFVYIFQPRMFSLYLVWSFATHPPYILANFQSYS